MLSDVYGLVGWDARLCVITWWANKRTSEHSRWNRTRGFGANQWIRSSEHWQQAVKVLFNLLCTALPLVNNALCGRDGGLAKDLLTVVWRSGLAGWLVRDCYLKTLGRVWGSRLILSDHFPFSI